MKNLKSFDQLFEISQELIDSAYNKMKSKGQDERAERLKKSFDIKNNPIYNEFIGKNIGDYEITNIKKEEGHGKELLEITLSRYGNTAIYYDILNDEYLVGNEKFEMFISRKEARLLGKIAATVNPDTQYIKGTGDFRIKGY